MPVRGCCWGLVCFYLEDKLNLGCLHNELSVAQSALRTPNYVGKRIWFTPELCKLGMTPSLALYQAGYPWAVMPLGGEVTARIGVLSNSFGVFSLQIRLITYSHFTVFTIIQIYVIISETQSPFNFRSDKLTALKFAVQKGACWVPSDLSYRLKTTFSDLDLRPPADR
ncbi:hypothetical protein P692DRAFT_20821607 [Suillus brevipes Sb2]|nr:hypothetical protein P692DRAFT_20821607 [Suillus brevipes Sb2]